MKKTIISLFFTFFFCFVASSQTADGPDKMMSQAEAFAKQKENAKARYSYTEAYKQYLAQQNISKAVDCGVQAATLYYKDNLYKEAFDYCKVMEQNVLAREQGGKALPDLRYKINKVRMQMFIALKRPAQAKQYLDLIRTFANSSSSDEIHNDFLYTQAGYYYSFGMIPQGDESFRTLIAKYKKDKNYTKVSECYKTLIGVAVRSNNAGLVARTYDKYIIWTDSVKALTAKDELSVMTRKYNASQETVSEKSHSISIKNGIIVALSVVIAILAAALVFGAFMLMRYMMLTRKQKKNIEIANEHNELKTKFIQNISTQMEPTLKTMDGSQPAVKALLGFSEHIQELSEIENTLGEGFPTSDIEVSAFSQAVVEKVKKTTTKNITFIVDAPKMTIKANQEQLERVLLHLLNNAVEHTPENGKIWLEFKKRGAHTHQFVVTDTGSGIPAQAQENLFKPFTEVRDLSKGDGLGLPICSLIATKMNGSLSIDKTYGKGAKFILELHS